MGRRGRNEHPVDPIILYHYPNRGIYAGFARDPYAKLIAIGIIGGGIMPLIVARGYVDVAAALAVIIPLSTIFVLQLCKRGLNEPWSFIGLILLIIGTWVVPFPVTGST